MRETDFKAFLPSSFDSELSNSIYTCFHNDPLVAASLNEARLATWQAISEDRLRYWQPGLYALSLLDETLPTQNLRDLSLPVPEDWLSKATQILQSSELHQSGLNKLSDAVLLALLLRDYRIKAENWYEVTQFMAGVEGQLSFWATPVMILGRIVPDFDLFVAELLRVRDPELMKEVGNLIVHANENTVMPLAHHLEYYRALLSQTPLEIQIASLQALKAYQPDEIIRNLANSFLTDLDSEEPARDIDLIGVEKLQGLSADLKTKAELYALAGRGPEAGQLMSQAADLLEAVLLRHLEAQAESLRYLAPEESALAERQIASIQNFKAVNPWPSQAQTQAVSAFATADMDSLLMALAENPNDPSALQAYADLLLKNGQYDEASDAARKAVNFGLNDPALIIWYCKFPTRKAEIDENIQTIFDGLKLNPENSRLHLALAGEFRNKNDVSSAVTALERLLAIENLSMQDHYEIAQLFSSLGEKESAIKALETGLETEADAFPIETYLNYFYAFIEADELGKAADLAADYTPEAVHKADYLLAIADLEMARGQYQAAKEVLKGIAIPEKDKALSPEESTHHLSRWGYYYRFARLEQYLGDIESARHYAVEAWKTDQISALSYLLILELTLQAADFNSFDNLYKLHSERRLSLGQAATVQNLAAIRNFVQTWQFMPSAPIENVEFTEDSASPLEKISLIFAEIWQSLRFAIQYWQAKDWKAANASFKEVIDPVPLNPIANLILMNYLSYKLVEARNRQKLHVRKHLPESYTTSASDEAEINRQLAYAGKYLPGEVISPVLRLSQAVIQGKWQRGASLLGLVNTPAQAAIALSLTDDSQIAEGILKAFPDSPELAFQSALGLLESKPAEAYEKVQAVLGQLPEDPLPHALAAYASQGGPEKSVQSFQAALAIWPDEPDWHAQAGISQQHLKRFAEAARHLEAAIDADPENTEYWQILGNIKIDEQDFEAAKEYFNQAVKRFPENAKALESLALINQEMGLLDGAISSLKKAMILEPQTPRYREKLSSLYFDKGDYQAAVDQANAVLSQFDESSAALLVKIKVYIKRKIFEEARHLISSARKRNIDQVPFEIAANEIEAMTNRKNSLNYSENLLRSYPDDPRVLKNHAFYLIEHGYHSQASEILQRALHQASPDAEAYLMLGKSYAAQKNHELALKYFNLAIEIAPGMNDALLGIGQIYQSERDLDRAILYYERALANSSLDAKPFQMAASVYKEKKDYHKAEAILREAIQNFPSDLNLKGQLASVMAINLVNNLQESTKKK